MESVKFNSGEDVVVAGSQSGTLKIWDLEAAKSESQFAIWKTVKRRGGQHLH